MVKKSHLKPPSRGLARTVYTAENFNLHIFFCNDVKFKSFWVKLANSPQTGTQTKESKLRFKSQLKMLRISQCPWAACKLGLQMNSSQQQFLNKRKKASVKNPNTEADPVPFALFWSEFFQSPTGDA